MMATYGELPRGLQMLMTDAQFTKDAMPLPVEIVSGTISLSGSEHVIQPTYRLRRESNCPNCGAVVQSRKCAHCGTSHLVRSD